MKFIRNALFWFMLSIVLITCSIVLFIGDVMIGKITPIVSEITTDLGGSNETIVNTASEWTTYKSWYVDGLLFVSVVLLTACLLSSFFTINNITSYIISSIVSFIFIVGFFYISSFFFAYLFSTLTGFTFEGQSISFLTYPDWLKNNFINIIVGIFIAQLLSAFLKGGNEYG